MLHVITTRRSERALARRKQPLAIQIELLFSCLLRKRMLFDVPAIGTAVATNHPLIRVHFLPVTTRDCRLDQADHPPLETLPVTRGGFLAPRWVRLDNVDGEWLGDFGWSWAHAWC